MATTLAHIQLRRKTAAAWTSANEVLLAGEQGVETDTGKHKLGNGSTAWNALPYQAPDATALAGMYVPFGSTAPDHTVVPVWVDSSTVPPVLKGWTGSVWAAIGGTTSSITITDLGNGTASATTAGTYTITDLGNGLASISGATVTDLGNGLAVAA